MIETSFTMPGTTSVILQLHQILRLPWTMSLRIDPAHIWNVIYHARRNKRQPPPSQNTAPATENESHDWSVSHMKRHLQCAVQQESPFQLTKYCTLPRKMNLSIDPPHIWNVIYNARNNKRHPPTPPNTAPATKNGSQDWSCSHMKRHLPCV